MTKRNLTIPYPEDIEKIKTDLLNYGKEPNFISYYNILKFIYPEQDFDLETILVNNKLQKVTFKIVKIFPSDKLNFNLLHANYSGYYEEDSGFIYFEVDNKWFKVLNIRCLIY